MSRAVASVGMVLFGINALRGIHPRLWLRERWWLMGVAWVGMYALSYFWSDNIPIWWDWVQVKLPFLLLPLSFAYLPAFTQKQLQAFTVSISLLLLGGVAYSLSFFLKDPTLYISQYKYSKVLPTPVYHEHIRFSLAVSLFVVWCVYYWNQAEETWLRWFIIFTVVVLSIYLHILAAKSGLVVWYLFLLLSFIYLLFQKKTRLIGLGIFAVMIIWVVVAYQQLPTFKERIGYVQTTLTAYKDGSRTADFSDIGRVISYNIGYKLIMQHPLYGVGVGDMLDEMRKGYTLWYPQVPMERRLLPHNQLMIVALGCGIPAMLLFAAWLLAPLLKVQRNRSGFFFVVVWLALLLALMVEPMFEVQFGVFVFLFFFLWQRHAMLHEGSPEN